jgi:tetratricopeptide (TPR) repeat protein
MLLIVAVAFVMGLPALRGGFVSADDLRLVRDHVLVNHPSLNHAVKLFAISHHDLYQPLPLLTFSAEFAVAYQLGLFGQGGDADEGAWLFHLDNILLHALNAVLVWMVLRRCGGGRAAGGVAFAVAVLFAAHPLQAEVVAWMNGRMMLLSTLFALASLLSFAAWLDTPKKRWFALTVVFVLCCAISKVRVGLPVLLIVVALARRAKFNRRFWTLWLVSLAVTVVFAWINIQATARAELFAGGAEQLQGPRLVRVLLALACHFQHFVWPVGLSSFYPAPEVVTWVDGATWRAIAIVAVGVVVIGVACWRSREARLGLVWFVFTIASTLPLIPARNTLAADRYMYLPIVGLLWLVASFVGAAWTRRTVGWSIARRRSLSVGVGLVLLVPMILMSWHVAASYADAVARSGRIARLSPDTPGVWNALGWAHFNAGQKLQQADDGQKAAEHFEQAMQCAMKDLAREDVRVRCDSYQLIGMSTYRLGRIKEALTALARAIDVDPEAGLAHYRLGRILQEQGRLDDAVARYGRAVELSPRYNPAITRLARCYRQLGRWEEARAMCLKALENNAYEVSATLTLVELDIEDGTPEALEEARQRLTTLLDWAPEHTTARTRLGEVLARMERYPEAIQVYQQVIERDPSAATAVVNLALLYRTLNDGPRALAMFQRAATLRLEPLEQALEVHDFFAARGLYDQCAKVRQRYMASHPDSTAARVFEIWSLALTGPAEDAAVRADALPVEAQDMPLALAAGVVTALAQRDASRAVELTEALCAAGPETRELRQRLLQVLEAFSTRYPEVPWTYYVVARLSLADGQVEAAQAFLGLFEQVCDDPLCKDHADKLRAMITRP